MIKKILISFSLLSGRPCSEGEERVYFSENKICMIVEKEEDLECEVIVEHHSHNLGEQE